jgi:hypothetical protein
MLNLIDDYNLLSVANVPGRIRGRANLEKARLAARRQPKNRT